MKKPFSRILFLFLIVPVIFIGCKKSELIDDSKTSSVKSEQVILPYTPCGNQLVANLYEYGKTGISYGTLTVGNDATNLYLTFNTGTEYLLLNTYLYVGSAEDFSTIQGTLNTNGTGEFHISKLPYIYAPGPSAPLYQKVIPLSSLPDCFIIVALADIPTPTVENPGAYIRTSAKVPTAFKSLGYYLNYCKQVCGSGCETAYAFGNNSANCFLTIHGINSNNWGWSNGPLDPGTYNWPIYAGAGQCNTSKGTLVGTLNVVYSPPTAKITYNMGGNVHLSTTQLYVGNKILPMKNNRYTTAPGQFPYKHKNLNGVSSDTFTIERLSGKIYIAAHADVCW